MVDPKKLTYLQKVDVAYTAHKFRRFSSQSYQWYMKKFQSLGGSTARAAADEEAQRRGLERPAWTIGQFYYFGYNPKHKDKLPYYDVWPMGVMVGPAKRGFYMLNFHYLPPRYRAVFLDQLLAISTDRRYDEKTKLKLTYRLLKSSEKYALFKPCFHHYLVSHLTTKLTLIPATDWDKMLFLPTQKFVKASNSQVWKDSLEKAAE